jgi:DNA-binding NtrC family response regulator
MSRVLIFEPDASVAAGYKERLDRKGLWAVTVDNPVAALHLVEKQYFHLVLWRVNAAEDIASLLQIKNTRPFCSLVAMSHSLIPALIVSAMRAGACDFWNQDSGLESFDEVVAKALSQIVPDPISIEEWDIDSSLLVGRHPKILEVIQLIQNIKDTDSTILLTGESGTGKEVVARSIHQVSTRKKYPWIAINCGAIPASLLESELFGHVKGAFTGAVQNRIGRFQLAGQGTLFLDEIGDLPFDLQAKLLRAIQTRQFEPVGSPHTINLEARIIAATNQDLEVAVAQRKFREDLYYRLNVIPVSLPPLRTRKSDIPLLAKVFIERFCKANGKVFSGISAEAMHCLVQYHWPGNVRELENLMERVVVLKRSAGVIELKDLPIEHFKNVRLDRFLSNVALPEEGLDFNEAVNDFENELILQALQKTEGNKNKAATLLNLNRTTLVEKLKRKGLRIAS